MREIRKLIIAMSVAASIGALTRGMAEDDVVPWVESVDPGFDFSSDAWNGALVMKDFMKPGAFRVMGRSFSTDASVASEVYALRTSEALYLGVVCYDEDGLLRKAGTSRDASGIPFGNKFEIYIDGDLNEHQSYYQFIINPDGVAWISKKGQAIPSDTWTYKAEQEEGAWKFWVRIPYTSINVAPDTDLVHANFFRNYQPLKEPLEAQYSTWRGAAPASFASLRPLHFGRP